MNKTRINKELDDWLFEGKITKCSIQKPNPVKINIFEDENDDKKTIISKKSTLLTKQAVSDEVIKVQSQSDLEQAILSAGGYLSDNISKGVESDVIDILSRTSVSIQEEGISNIFDDKDGQTTLKFIENHEHYDSIEPIPDDEEE